MANKKQENDVIYSGSSKWQNLDTGEIIETNDVIKRTGRNGFMITYLTAIIQLIDSLGNKKMEVVKYILNEMDKSTNTLIITTEELAKKAKVSRQTVSDTLQKLEKAEIIKRRTGAIMIHGKLIHRGNEGKEKFLLARFQEFADNNSLLNED